MGYRSEDGVYRYPDRKAIFLGDFIDRGPRQLDTVNIARRMVETGNALAVMGNHEFNALAWHKEDPEQPGEYLRPHTPSNHRQHQRFLEEVGAHSRIHDDIMAWFSSLPLYLDLPGLRVIHACWHPEYLDALQPHLDDDNRLDDGLLTTASRQHRMEYRAVETVLKGLEVPLPPGSSFHDKDGKKREHIRIRWWDRSQTTYRTAALLPSATAQTLPDAPMPLTHGVGYDDAKPLFIGHYWMNGTLEPLTPTIACVDYSAGKGSGPLAAYRWSGESQLTARHFEHCGTASVS